MKQIPGLCPAVVLIGIVACARPIPFRPPHDRVLEARNFNYQHDVELFTVSNGLMVALAPEKNTNLARVDVRYRVGAAEDPPGKAGLAHLVEHMLFLPRADNDAPTLGERLRDLTLSYNAYTIWDETHYTATVLAERLPELLEIERDRLATTCERFDAEAFAREQKVVVQEILQESEARRSERRRFVTAIFGANHAYARSVGGSPEEIAKLTLTDVCTFIDEHYGPRRAVLVVSGNFEPAITRQAVGKLFGPISKPPGAIRRVVDPLPAAKAATRIELDVEEATAVIAFRAPSWGHDAWIEADVAGTLLGEPLAAIAKKHKFISDTSQVYVGGYRGGATIIAISVTDPKELDRAVDSFFAARDQAVSSWASVDLVGLKARRMGRLVRSLEPFPKRAAMIADYLQYTDHQWLMLNDMAVVDRLKGADLQRYADKHLARAAARIVHVIPGGKRADARKRVAIPTTRKEYDIESSLSPVDPAEADTPVAASERPQPVARTKFTLDNGLDVVFVASLSHPVIDARLVFPVGYAHDPSGKSGVALLAGHLLEHDYERKYRLADLHKVKHVLTMGGDESVEVSERSTIFRIRGLSMFADGLIWQLHWLVESGRYRSKTLALLRKHLREAGKDASDEDDERYAKVLRESLYGKGHPYAAATFSEALVKIGKGDLQGFRRRHFRANGATLIVTGQFNTAAVREQVERLFGAWKKRPPPAPAAKIPAARAARGPQYLALADADAAQVSVLMAFATAPGFRGKDAPRRVVAEMLRQRMAAVRERLGASYGVSVGHWTRQGPGILLISAKLDPGNAGKALALMRAAVAALRDGDERRQDFVHARRKTLERALAATVDSGSTGAELEFIASHELPRSYYDQVASAIAGMTLARVEALVERELAADGELILVAGPKDVVAKTYADAGIERFRLVE